MWSRLANWKLGHYWFGFTLLSLSLLTFVLAGTGAYLLNRSDFWGSLFLQVGGVLLALALAYFFFEHHSYDRQRRVRDTIHLFTGHLRLMAVDAAVRSAEQILMDSDELVTIDRSKGNNRYERARELIMGQQWRIQHFSALSHSYDSLEWVMQRFSNMATFCGQTFRIIGPGIIEYGALIRALVNIEASTKSEQLAWEEFAKRKGAGTILLPAEAIYNLVALAKVAIQLVEIIDSRNYAGPSGNGTNRANSIVARAVNSNWGDW